MVLTNFNSSMIQLLGFHTRIFPEELFNISGKVWCFREVVLVCLGFSIMFIWYLMSVFSTCMLVCYPRDC